jgi:replicative DNA helicase
MTLKLFGLKNCDTCRKALREIEASGQPAEFVDIRTEADLKTLLPRWLAAAGDKLSAEPWSMVYEPGASISAVRSHIRRMVKRTGAKAVFVDYIGLITAPEKENRLQEVSHVSRQLKQIAGEMGIVLFPLCQLNRNVEDKEPALHHLKESGQIEQDADAVALIHRAWIKEGDMALEGWVKLAKVRDGQTGRIDVVYNGPVTTFKPKVF